MSWKKWGYLVSSHHWNVTTPNYEETPIAHAHNWHVNVGVREARQFRPFDKATKVKALNFCHIISARKSDELDLKNRVVVAYKRFTREKLSIIFLIHANETTSRGFWNLHN